MVLDAFERRQLAVPLTGQEMNNRLLTLYRRAGSDMQEGGTNTLFLAAGSSCAGRKPKPIPSVQATLLARHLRGDLPAYPPFVLP